MEITREGRGLSGQTDKPAPVDTAGLAPNAGRHIGEPITGMGFSDRPTTVTKPGGADVIDYRMTVAGGSRPHVYSNYPKRLDEPVDRPTVAAIGHERDQSQSGRGVSMCSRCHAAITGTAAAVTPAIDVDVRRPKLGLREREVLIAWVLHETKAGAAQELSIAESTVRTVIQRIRTKYHSVGRPATTQVMLLIRAIQDGIVTVEML
jgi:hypothetical protein